MTIEDLIAHVETYNKEEVDFIRRAYDRAEELHSTQTRRSGEPYIIHPLSVAYILSELHVDRDTLCAALLHDTLEDTKYTKEDIAHEFNQDIANLVAGVTNISKLNFSSKEEEKMANTRKIITSITSDVRIIIIKLADRLHNMRTLQYNSASSQQINSIETMEIFVPLAYYIGAYRIKTELEDLSFQYIQPDMYKRIEEKRNKLESEIKEILLEMLNKIKSAMDDRRIPNEIKLRTKNIYGIYKKLSEGHKILDIHDLFALKIMVDDIDNCYRTLGIAHEKYQQLNGTFKDYMWNPKTNMYRSLHTTLIGPGQRLVQAQIRTFDMDKVNSFGLATYWDINKGQARIEMQKDLREKYQFFKSLVEIESMFGDNREFVQGVKRELFTDNVYVYNSKGEIIQLPKGSTPIDYAYRISVDEGNTLAAAIVNDEYVPLDYVLKNKDRIRIIIDNLSFGPRGDWLDKAHTAYAKKMIREFSNKS